MKLLVNLFNKYMSADEEQDNSFDFKLLNRKRGKSKSKIKKSTSLLLSKKDDEDFEKKNFPEMKNLDIARENIRHFFHFNWDDDSYEKEIIKISRYMTNTNLFWYLIDSSYFSEDNIEQNVHNITEKYLETGSMNNNPNEEGYISNNVINQNNHNNKNDEAKSEKTLYSIINFLNYDKKGKYFSYISSNEFTKIKINQIKNFLFYYINLINHMNQDRIKKLERFAKDIQTSYNLKNNSNLNNDTGNIPEDNKLIEYRIHSKNQLSLNIRNKFWYYIHQKEKNFLIKRESKNNQEKDNKENKDENKDDTFNLDGCNICNIEDLGQYNYLYECIQCGVKVHPFCYRMKTSPDPKKWKCSKCKMFSYKEATNIECLLCPVKGGAMQMAKISKDSHFYKRIMSFRKKEENNYNILNSIHFKHKGYIDMCKTYQDYPWIHLSCALWNNNVKIDIYDKKKHIKFEENNIINKYNSYCSICKLNNYGPTIKCKIENCQIYFHPECARSNDYYLEMDNVKKNLVFSLYCQNHRPNRFVKYINKVNNSYNDEIFYFGEALNFVYDLYKNIKTRDFYPVNNKEENITSLGLYEDDESENVENKNKFIKSRSKYRKNIHKRRRLVSSSRHSIYIDIKNNNENKELKKQEKLNENLKEENNIIKNCVSHIKINSDENEKMFPSSGDNNQMINNSQYNVNLTNETNSVKSNLSHNYSNSSDNNKSSTKYESFPPFVLDQKEEFASCLVKYIKDFYNKNRIICTKEDGKYAHPKKEDLDEVLSDRLDEYSYEDLKDGLYGIKDVEFKGIDKHNKKYDEIYKNEEEFKSYFKKKIEADEKNSKNNENNQANIIPKISKSKRRRGLSKVRK